MKLDGASGATCPSTFGSDKPPSRVRQAPVKFPRSEQIRLNEERLFRSPVDPSNTDFVNLRGG